MDYEEFSKRNQNELMLDENILELVREYCSIVAKHTLSEKDSDKLQNLLNVAVENSRLDFWIHEVDHFMNHEIGSRRGREIFPVETESLRLELIQRLDECSREYDVSNDPNDTAEIVEEMQEFVHDGNERCKEVQEKLKDKGLYPGPIDGQVGPLTQRAIKKFQRDHDLNPDGKIDSKTCIALSLKE